jgi:hypothetical protein
MFRRWLAVFVLLSAACSDTTGSLPPPPETAPTVDLSVGFGDPPVTGVVEVRRQDPSDPWSFSVDLDANGSVDAAGQVGNGADVPFEFTTPGIHRVRVELSLGGQRFQTERLVIVNDLAASEVVRTVAIPPRDEPEPSLEGIAIGQGSTGLELYVAMAFAKRVFRLDPVTLEVQAEISLASENLNTLEGMDLDPAGEALYVVSKSHRLITLTAPDLTVESILPVDGAAFTVHAMSLGVALTGGEGSISIVDTREGTILNSRLILGAVNFAVASDETALALILRPDDGPRFIRFLRVPEFTDIGTTVLPLGFEPSVLSFEPSGELLYVLGGTSESAQFIAIDAASLQIVFEQPLEGPPGAFRLTIANAHATSLDGRFVVFPSLHGAYVVDTSVDLPLLRIPLGCCNVAASPTTNEFYFANFLPPEVSIVGLTR